jgi:hypothetical protein
MSETDQKPFYRSRKKAALNEIIVLFSTSWVLCFMAKILRLGINPFSGVGLFFQVWLGTLLVGSEIFVFAYVLSRFFKQYKTGCAFVIIALFAYVLWAGMRVTAHA